MDNIWKGQSAGHLTGALSYFAHRVHSLSEPVLSTRYWFLARVSGVARRLYFASCASDSDALAM